MTVRSVCGCDRNRYYFSFAVAVGSVDGLVGCLPCFFRLFCYSNSILFHSDSIKMRSFNTP